MPKYAYKVGCTKEEKKTALIEVNRREKIYKAAKRKRRDVIDKYSIDDAPHKITKSLKSLSDTARKQYKDVDINLHDKYKKYLDVSIPYEKMRVVRHVSVEDLPKEPSVQKIGMTRQKKESLKSFQVRALKKFYRTKCGTPLKTCFIEDTESLDDLVKDLDETRPMETLCSYCPSPEASDDTWLSWGKYAGFKISTTNNGKKVTVSKKVVKKPVKKVAKTKPKPPVPKKAKKPVKKVKATLKGTKLTAKQKAQLKDLGYCTVTRSGKKHRITPSRVNRGIVKR